MEAGDLSEWARVDDAHHGLDVRSLDVAEDRGPRARLLDGRQRALPFADRKANQGGGAGSKRRPAPTPTPRFWPWVVVRSRTPHRRADEPYSRDSLPPCWTVGWDRTDFPGFSGPSLGCHY